MHKSKKEYVHISKLYKLFFPNHISLYILHLFHLKTHKTQGISNFNKKKIKITF